MVQLAVQVACPGSTSCRGSTCGGGGPPQSQGQGPIYQRRGKREVKFEASKPLPVVEKNEEEFLAHIGLGGEEAERQKKK